MGSGQGKGQGAATAHPALMVQKNKEEHAIFSFKEGNKGRGQAGGGMATALPALMVPEKDYKKKD